MGSKRGGEQLAVIANAQMQQLMDDHAILERNGFSAQFLAEGDAPRR